MESVGGHNALLGLHNPVGKKEWRVVTDGSARDRLTADGSIDHSRVNGSARIRPLHIENSRNGRVFHSGASSGSSSDSDHHTNDAKHSGISTRESLRQNGEDGKIYDELCEQETISNGHSSSASNGIPLEFGVMNSSKHDTLEQRLHDVIRQREHLQRVEAELRAQFIARSEVIRVQNSFEEQAKQHASIVSDLQEQLQEREHKVHELEQELEERERQLHANQKEASEAVNQVWAKDGLLREQTSELANIRRERDTLLVDQKATISQFESDRGQLVSRLQDLEDQLQEKDRQLQEMDDQHRTLQETLAYKDKQLQEAQAWVQRAQELDAFYANSHNSLHAELRDRNEQINQLWLGQQRHLAEIERYHSQTIQRLRMEVAEVREQNRVLKGGSAGNLDSKSEQSLHPSSVENDRSSSTDSSLKLRKGGPPGINQGQVENTVVFPLPASPVIGATASVLTGAPIPVLHQFPGQPGGILPTIAAAHTQITASNFSTPVVVPAQQQLPPLHHQQPIHCKLIQQPQPSQRFAHPPPRPVYSHFPDTKSPISFHPRGSNHQHQQIEQLSRDQVMIDQGGITKGMDFPHMSIAPGTQQHSANMQLSNQTGQLTHQESSPSVEKPAAREKIVNEEQTLDGLSKGVALQGTQERPLQQQLGKNDHSFEDRDSVKDVFSAQVSPEYSHATKHNLELRHSSIETDDMEQNNAIDQKIEDNQTTTSQGSAVDLINSQEVQVYLGQHVQNNAGVPMSVVSHTSTAEENGKAALTILLDEKSLLACLVRAIPSEPSARIKISTTLPNRLGKMLAPLHWHDYKKHYGRLDDFISSHPKLFVIDGDFVHLREGAHAIISATTAVAKVAAAASAPSTLGTNWPPTVAITPVAQSQIQRMRKNTAPLFLGAQEVSRKSGNQVKLDTLFSHVQMNGPSRLHQGFGCKDIFGERQGPKHSQRIVPLNEVNDLGGSKLISVLGCGSDGTPSSSTDADFVEISSASYGPSSNTQDSEMSFGGRQGPRSNAVDAEPPVRKALSTSRK